MRTNSNSKTVSPSGKLVCLFFFNTSLKKFDTTLYTPLLTQDKITTEEVVQFISELERVLLECQLKIGCLPMVFLRTLYIILSILPILSVPIAIPLIVTQIDNPNLIPIVIPCLVFGSVIFSCWLHISAACFRLYLSRREKRITQRFIDNRSWSFKERGFRWMLPSSFPSIIELWEDELVQITSCTEKEIMKQDCDKAQKESETTEKPVTLHVLNPYLVKIDLEAQQKDLELPG